jgi:hypothetical protein
LSLTAAPKILLFYSEIGAQKTDGLPVQRSYPYYLFSDFFFAVDLLEQVPICQIPSGNNPFNNKSGMDFDVHGIDLYIPKEGLIEFEASRVVGGVVGL